MKPSTSLIISTYNWPEALELCLLSVARQSQLPAEILIADDGSNPMTRSTVDRLRSTIGVPIVHLWHQDQGFRKAAIMNRAFVNANGEYVIQIDGDIVLHPDFIRDHINAATPGYFVAGTRVITSEKLKNDLLHNKRINISIFEKGTRNFLNGVHFPLFGKLLRNYRCQTKDIYYVKGCNMAFWKKDLYQVNGYDETFEGWGYEDSDLAIRLYNSGVRKKFLKMAGIAYHLWHSEYCRDREQYNYSLLGDTRDCGKSYTKVGMDRYEQTKKPLLNFIVLKEAEMDWMSA
ncbi:glycosyltransferase family 2 protein [Flavihumibacter petaseus]|nr:glycosyltransferase family 2 protein [Flavihumibacter petaseus]